LSSISEYFRGIPDDQADYRYISDKWSVREVIRHLVDIEWVFAYRTLHIARQGKLATPGVSQHEYMDGSQAVEYSLSDLIKEFVFLRSAVCQLFKNCRGDVLDRQGVASGCEFTVRALLYVIVGHARHHIRILKERYGLVN